MVIVVGFNDVAKQIILFVVTSSLVGLGFGVFIGRATLRRHRRGIDPRHPIFQERVLVQPDVALFAENERLRDRLVTARARIEDLEAALPVPTPITTPADANIALRMNHPVRGPVKRGRRRTRA